MKYICLALLIPFTLLAQQKIQKEDIRIINGDNLPKLEITVPNSTNQINPFFMIDTQTNVIFQIPASGIIPVANGGTGTNSFLGALSGITTNVPVMVSPVLSNSFHFSHGVLTNITTLP